MKKFLSILISIILMVSLFAFEVSAANNSIISFSANTITIGDNVTVTLTLKSDKPIYAYEYKLSYDANKLNIDNHAGVIHEANAASGEKSLSFKYTFTSIAVGNANIATSECKISSDGTDDITLSNAGATLSIKDVALSNNANLKSLSISKVTISPKFSANRTTYSAKVAYETTKVNVTARTAHSGAKVVSVTGNTDLKVGENAVVVTVQAANGTQKKYTINVTRLKEGEKLSADNDEETENPVDETKLQVDVAGTAHTIQTEISEDNILKGFKLSTTTYNETEVPVATDDGGVYTVYYLKTADNTDLIPYTYNKELRSFERLKYLSLGENIYIFEKIPSEFAVPENMYSSNLKIGDFSVDCLISNDMSLDGMHYIYCYVNGNYALYRYDSLENTIQRAPELKLEKIQDVIEKDNLLTRFNSLSTNGKVIILGLLIAVLGAISLIVILVIFLIKKFSKENSQDIFLDAIDDDFDEIVEEVETVENIED